MTIRWSFSYNLFVKFSDNNMVHLKHGPWSIPMDIKHSVINGLHCINLTQ